MVGGTILDECGHSHIQTNTLRTSVLCPTLLHTNLYFRIQNWIKSSKKRDLLEQLMSLCDLWKSCMTSHAAVSKKRQTKKREDECLQGLLEEYDITWKFNLSRAPWWGRQFERLIGVAKSTMYKVTGGVLTWSELSEVLLDVETQINWRSLSYVEDDVKLATLTMSSFLFQQTSQLPKEKTWRIEELDLRKCAKYCKNSLWRWWHREYLTPLRGQHNLPHKAAKFQPKARDVVIMKTENKNRGSWPPGIVNKTYPKKDGITRTVQL